MAERPTPERIATIRRIHHAIGQGRPQAVTDLLAEVDALTKTIDDMCRIAAEANKSDVGLDAYTPEDCISTIVGALAGDRDEARDALARLREAAVPHVRAEHATDDEVRALKAALAAAEVQR